ncbi:NAD(P)/FAD-dependent oxidoreductase [Microbacterium deminutum]|uniref:NAD(P)/FAD-dependent oxidoreductase n=1 Tax=Microbacterium deminutum TaxID=344164 RepID=A0ABN2R1Z6_9MICO
MPARTHRPATEFDAVVVGAGPNGLAAAVTLARAGLTVCVFEQSERAGGGSSTAELTLPGFRHDVCSAVHPLAFESRFFREFELRRRIDFITPDIPFAHPLDGGRAGIAYRDLARTARALGKDGRAYRRLVGPLAARAREVADLTGSSLLRFPPHPVTAALFASATLEQGSPVWNARFQNDAAPSMLTGVAAHAILPLPSLAAAGAGLALTAYAHAQGWPIPVGGSQSIADAMTADLESHGGRVVTGILINSLDELPTSRVTLLDVTPHALLRIGGDRFPTRYALAVRRFRYGSAVAKVDFALSQPVPWQRPELHDAGTLHLGGTRQEIAVSESEVARGRLSDSPYVLISQPSVFDSTRAPEGAHTLWAYTHVPALDRSDRRDVVIRQIERFAPGFRDTILATSSATAIDVQRHNPNYPGGDIAAGTPNLAQLIRRPVVSRDPWRTPAAGVYLCSASTTPGPGVHGLAGWFAALSALRHDFGSRALPDLSIGA